MSKIIELLGLLAPLVALGLLIVHRRRAPMPAAVGMLGAALADIGSLTDFAGNRVSWFGGGGFEGMLHRLDGWSLLRFGLVVAGIVVLLIAAFLGKAKPLPRIPLAVGGSIAAAIGVVMRLVPIDLAGPDGVERVLATMALEVVQFGSLGLGVLLLAIAVVSGRDDHEEPLLSATRLAQRAIEAARSR